MASQTFNLIHMKCHPLSLSLYEGCLLTVSLEYKITLPPAPPPFFFLIFSSSPQLTEMNHPFPKLPKSYSLSYVQNLPFRSSCRITFITSKPQLKSPPDSTAYIFPASFHPVLVHLSQFIVILLPLSYFTTLIVTPFQTAFICKPYTL